MVLEQAADLENRSARIVLMQFLIIGLQVYLNVSPEELAKVIPVKYNSHVGDGSGYRKKISGVVASLGNFSDLPFRSHHSR